MEKTVRTLAQFEEEATLFAGSLKGHAPSATLVTLSGELGAGKTAFTQKVAQALGITETVNSPTFVLEKIYQLGIGKPFARLIHIDAYRLERSEELRALGFDELMQDEGNLVMLEWPEKVAGTLPVPTVRIAITVNPDDSRTISYG